MTGPRRILVTGATGGLGLALVGAVAAAGHRVRATGRSRAHEARISALGAEFVPADLTAPGAAEPLCDGVDSVIHAAALTSGWGPPAPFEAINVEATRALLGAARRAGCGRFVLVSSPSIFAEMRDRIGLPDDAAAPARPLGHYARTKLAAERLVLAADGPGLRTAAVRPRALTGPDDRVVLPRLAALATRRRVPLLRGGRALVELTDVRDAAEAIRLAEERIEAVAGRPVNVSGGRPASVRRIAGALGQALGTEVRFVRLPLSLARAAAAALEARAARDPEAPEPWLTRYALAQLAFSQTFAPGRARDALGFRPRHDALDTLCAVARERRP